MSDKRFGSNVINDRSIGINLDDINYSSLPDMYQPSPGFPAHTPAATDSATPTNTIQQQQPPPPLPPRQQTQQQPPINYSTALYNNNNCSNPYNSYNPYNNYNNGYYNNYSYNNSNYTYANNNNNNTFSQQAETTTRQAFESVESVVRTFSSIAMMLDSTYQAVFNSFRAVLSVSDHMSRLRSHFNNIFTTLAFLPLFRYVMKRLGYLLAWMRNGSRAANEELLWQESSEMVDLPNNNNLTNLTNNLNNTTTWPVLLFFTVVTTGPWLLWKLLSAFTNKQHNHKHHEWNKKQTNHYIAHAQYDFVGSQGDELSFKKDSKLIVAPEEFQTTSPKGWLMASVDGEKVGLIPRNYVKIVCKQSPIQPTTNLQPQPTTHHQPQSTTNLQPQPTTHYQSQPATHHQSQPTTHQQPQPTAHQQPQPTTHHQPQPILHNHSTYQEINGKVGFCNKSLGVGGEESCVGDGGKKDGGDVVTS